MSDWRDTTSPDWVLRWGHGHEFDWLEQQLGLTPGTYALRQLGNTMQFADPHYNENKLLIAHELTETATGRMHRIVSGEISNGIYAHGYWKGA